VKPTGDENGKISITDADVVEVDNDKNLKA